jgi:hypothetical protein
MRWLWWVRLLGVGVLALVGVLAVLVIVARVAIPLAAPALATPTIPPDALRDCPRQVAACR